MGNNLSNSNSQNNYLKEILVETGVNAVGCFANGVGQASGKIVETKIKTKNDERMAKADREAQIEKEIISKIETEEDLRHYMDIKHQEAKREQNIQLAKTGFIGFAACYITYKITKWIS